MKSWQNCIDDKKLLWNEIANDTVNPEEALKKAEEHSMDSCGNRCFFIRLCMVMYPIEMYRTIPQYTEIQGEAGHVTNDKQPGIGHPRQVTRDL